MKKLFRILLYIYVFILFIFAFFLIYARIIDFKPDVRSAAYYSDAPDLLSDTSTITIITWNTSYFGQDQISDLTTELKSDTESDKKRILKNSEGIKSFMEEYKEFDFILLQEIDFNSKRSGSFNQYNFISELFLDRTASFALNYNVNYIPFPVLKPKGQVKSGLMIVSKYTPSFSIRYAYPPNDDFPRNLFDYDRCFLVNRYKLSNEKELIVINLHQSDFENRSQKNVENDFLFEFLKQEYDRGNYIIAGGDWNQTPANFKPAFQKDMFDSNHVFNLDISGLKDWKCNYDSRVPTVRDFNKPYKKGESLTSVNDFFLISPNIANIYVENIDRDFKYSTHQPVRITLKLK